jgi:hypothetical protein
MLNLKSKIYNMILSWVSNVKTKADKKNQEDLSMIYQSISDLM